MTALTDYSLYAIAVLAIYTSVEYGHSMDGDAAVFACVVRVEMR